MVFSRFKRLLVGFSLAALVGAGMFIFIQKFQDIPANEQSNLNASRQIAPSDEKALTRYQINSQYVSSSRCFDESERGILVDMGAAAGAVFGLASQTSGGPLPPTQVCQSSDLNRLFLVVWRSEFLDEVPGLRPTLEAETRRLFSATANPQLVSDALQRFRVGLFATDPIELRVGEQSLSFVRNELKLLTDFLWSSNLAACSIDSTRLVESHVGITCGSGDNRCFSQEAVELNIHDKEIVARRRCEKNCDVVGPQSEKVACE